MTDSTSGREEEVAATLAAKHDAPPPETTTKEDWEIQRDDHKKSADQAFRVRGFATAIDHYTKALSLDPEFVVLYSNRSAAYLANGESSKALKDARKCVELDASFTKGHSRLAAALLALKRFGQAKDSYRHVLETDPKNAAATKGVELCEKEITKRMTLEEQKRKQEEHRQKEKAAEAVAAKEEEDNEDDLLNDFFDEMEEVVAKKKEVATASNNAIRNDRKTLGTTQEQIERLLQPRHEWRNLNPYCVLQLPAVNATDDDISRRYKALSLLLHPDKNRSKLSTEEERDRGQLAYDQVQKAKIVLADADRKRYTQSLVEEGMKNGELRWKREQHQRRKGNDDDASTSDTLESIQEKEVMRIFAQVEQKRKDVEKRERKFEQREQQQEDDQMDKERKARKFDKQWRKEDRVDKRVGNWRDFGEKKKRKF
uniref:J domain-containing protein n=1 Tax=Pseudo-nitzschia australis TaxID=44445 RepID=A0A7S4ABT3_9STRA|mmetsp:Transcript_167/g.420  ORF Transcript_167/g.420 Transcript_167/m.420 type:complete len:428 (+) Transcript_167:67-1350(+)